MWSTLCLSFLVASSAVHGEIVPRQIGNGTKVDKETVSFYVMGDGPYGSKGRDMFPSQLQRLKHRPEFMIHLGDTHERQKDCTLTHFDAAADIMLDNIPVPTFVLPGDTDWYECNDKVASWNKWSERFLKFHENWPQLFDVKHQENRSENFSFVHKRVLFLGLHILYASVDDWDEWNNLVHDDTVWLKEQFESFGNDVGAVVILGHAYAHPRRCKEFYDELLLQAKAHDKPILYLHGDTHNFVVDRRFPSPNILRVVIDTTRDSDPMQVTVNPYSAVPFKLKRRPVI
jgi:hypothetical protein